MILIRKLNVNSKLKYIGFGFCIITVIIGAYVFCFPYFISANTPLEKADLIVVFPGGGPGRRQAGYQLVKQGYADSIAITSGSERGAKRYAEKNGLTGLLTRVSCGKARSTFEDALYVGELVGRHGFKSVILVTGSYHVPRASFLLQSVLADQGVTIYTYGISFQEERGKENGHRSQGWKGRADDWDDGKLTQGKMLFDERIKFLGSFVEMGIYRATGILINDYGWVRRVKNAVKEVVLFQRSGKDRGQRTEVGEGQRSLRLNG